MKIHYTSVIFLASVIAGRLSAELVIASIDQPVDTTNGIIDQQWEGIDPVPMAATYWGENGKPPGSVEDFSGTFKAAYSKPVLSLLYEITDQELWATGSWSSVDGVEVFLDLNLSQAESYDADDYQLNFRADPSVPTFNVGPRSAVPPDGSVRYEYGITESGYWVEVAIGLGLLGAPGEIIGADFHAADADFDLDAADFKWQTKLAWHDETNETWRNPSLMGTVRLPTGTPDPLAAWTPAIESDGFRLYDGVGWMYTAEYPWIYNYSLGKWIYVLD